jgi:hypothetical protein
LKKLEKDSNPCDHEILYYLNKEYDEDIYCLRCRKIGSLNTKTQKNNLIQLEPRYCEHKEWKVVPTKQEIDIIQCIECSIQKHCRTLSQLMPQLNVNTTTNTNANENEKIGGKKYSGYSVVVFFGIFCIVCLVFGLYVSINQFNQNKL